MYNIISVLCFVFLSQCSVRAKDPHRPWLTNMFGDDDFGEDSYEIIHSTDDYGKNEINYGNNELIEIVPNDQICQRIDTDVNTLLCEQILKSVHNRKSETIIVKKPKCPNHTICDIYMMRVLNKLLKMSNLKDVPYPENEIIPLQLRVTIKSLHIIQSFARGKNNPYTWAELDAALSDFFAIKHDPEDYYHHHDHHTHRYNHNSKSPEFMIITVISCLILMSFWLILKGVSIFKTLLLVLIIAFSIGLGTTWWNEIEEKRIEAIIVFSRNRNIPEDCLTNEISWWRYYFFPTKTECKDYHWAHVNPMNRVIFTEVLSKTFVNMFATSMPIIGDALGKTISGFTNHLPWISGAIISWIAIPILFPIFICFLILVVFLVLCGSGLRISTPFFSLCTKDPQVQEKPQISEPKEERPERPKKYIKTPSRRTAQVEYVSRRHIPLLKSQSEIFLEKKQDKRIQLIRQKSDIAPSNAPQRSNLKEAEFKRPKPKREKIVIIRDNSESEESYYEEEEVMLIPEYPMEESEFTVLNYDELSDQSDIALIPETHVDDVLDKE